MHQLGALRYGDIARGLLTQIRHHENRLARNIRRARCNTAPVGGRSTLTSGTWRTTSIRARTVAPSAMSREIHHTARGMPEFMEVANGSPLFCNTPRWALQPLFAAAADTPLGDDNSSSTPSRLSGWWRSGRQQDSTTTIQTRRT